MRMSARLYLLAALALGALSANAAERVTYFVPDALGSPVAAMDEQGNVLWRETYAPYGERKTKAAENNAKPAYTGKPEDTDTGLVYMGARMYDPETGRFTGMDPQGFKEGNPQSFGPYLYANNSPYKYNDPNGEAPTLPEAILTAYDGASFAWALAFGSPMDVAEAGADLKDDFKGLAIPIPGAGYFLKAERAAKLAEEISNPVSDTLARVTPGHLDPSTLGKAGDPDVFVTNADEIRGLNAAEIAKKLTIPQKESFNVTEFPSANVSGIASPINRTNPGFVGHGKTAGGASEFVIPNGPLPSGSTTRKVN